MGSCPDTDTDLYIHYIYINNLVFSTELIMLIGKADNLYPVSALCFLIYRRIEEVITKKYSILDTSILILNTLVLKRFKWCT